MLFSLLKQLSFSAPVLSCAGLNWSWSFSITVSTAACTVSSNAFTHVSRSTITHFHTINYLIILILVSIIMVEKPTNAGTNEKQEITKILVLSQIDHTGSH